LKALKNFILLAAREILSSIFYFLLYFLRISPHFRGNTAALIPVTAVLPLHLSPLPLLPG